MEHFYFRQSRLPISHTTVHHYQLALRHWLDFLCLQKSLPLLLTKRQTVLSDQPDRSRDNAYVAMNNAISPQTTRIQDLNITASIQFMC
jgi:hypothetical protein